MKSISKFGQLILAVDLAGNERTTIIFPVFDQLSEHPHIIFANGYYLKFLYIDCKLVILPVFEFEGLLHFKDLLSGVIVEIID